MLFISSLLLTLSASAFATPLAPRQGPIEFCTTVQSGYLTDSNGNAFTVDSSSSAIIVQAPPDTAGIMASFLNCSLGDSTDYFTAISIPNSQCLIVDIGIFGGTSTYYLNAGDCPAQPGVGGSNWKRVVTVGSPSSLGPPPAIYWELGSTLYDIPNDISVPSAVTLKKSSSSTSPFYLKACADVLCRGT